MFTSINPYRNSEIKSYPLDTSEEVNNKLQRSKQAFEHWREVTITERGAVLDTVSTLLLQDKRIYANMITLEMGKPLRESIAEIEKCALLCRYYAQKAPDFLDEKFIETDASKSSVQYHPLGSIFGIMPWNFPFWQVFRCIVPALMAGNSVLIKHAPNVQGCAQLIDQLIQRSTSYQDIFQVLRIEVKSVESVIQNDIIKAITFTGSTQAGSIVGQLASKYIKKSILELGGSNSFIVLEDANIEQAVLVGEQARLLNAGQSCIAAKRFIVHEKIVTEFTEKLKNRFERHKKSNPINELTELGVLARPDLVETLHNQVTDALEKGATLVVGGHFEENFYYPTILTQVTPEMKVYHEEVFGPVAVIYTTNSDKQAIDLANDTSYGLGTSVFTKNSIRASKFIKELEDGCVFINSMVKSDPKLPFGGTKQSGYGRELGEEGIKEFVNTKTVYWG